MKKETTTTKTKGKAKAKAKAKSPGALAPTFGMFKYYKPNQTK